MCLSTLPRQERRAINWQCPIFSSRSTRYIHYSRAALVVLGGRAEKQCRASACLSAGFSSKPFAYRHLLLLPHRIPILVLKDDMTDLMLMPEFTAVTRYLWGSDLATL